MLLLRNTLVYAPSSLGPRDILIAGGRIEKIDERIDVPSTFVEFFDAAGFLAVPGFIDNHVHVTGGGGEGGFRTRTPELLLSDAVRGGVTTLVGCLGTDGITRSMAALLAKARGLEAEGLTAFIYTGSYAVPVGTLTGSVERDLILIDKVIGVGEIALSDHRSSQPTFEDVARIAAEARRGGMLAGKCGVVMVHLGDGERGLQCIERILAETEIPASQFLPTHVNRNPRLFESSIDYARKGGHIDLTTSTVPRFLEEGEVKCSVALRRLLDAGATPDHISFSSDGQGSLPLFDAAGVLQGLSVGHVTSLWEEVRDAVLTERIPLETALEVITSSPARHLKLAGKGALEPGADADIVLLRPRELTIDTVIAKGRVLMRGGELLAKGTFE